MDGRVDVKYIPRKRYYTTEEVARIFSITEATVERMKAISKVEARAFLTQ